MVEILADFIFNPNICETLRLCPRPDLIMGNNSSDEFIFNPREFLRNIEVIDKKQIGDPCSEPQNATSTKKQRVSQYGQRVNGSRVGVTTIPILHIADIHVDTAYAEVCILIFSLFYLHI